MHAVRSFAIIREGDRSEGERAAQFCARSYGTCGVFLAREFPASH